ncbi:hypothetical protein DPMN_002916 [Dreissena polymorpha]|uniref:OTU domain-containing protein n=1 Tax=Dreissena polymorpha TaxID=45954 RepID=A0A9D4EI35_DREPO|nr:hypothetical protein DPMN_157550 [Dreissena polymorpha]KAH3879015.1 hypothetical protein DPMN_002916 [Dreissena polymorpha]
MEPTEDWESISKMLEEDFSDENKDTDENIVFIATKLQDELDNNLNDKQESANILEKDDNTEKSAEKNTYSDDNDSDNIPLADLVRQRQRQCKRSLFKGDSTCSESELDTDDDVADPTYRITKKDIHSSDSEMNEVPKRKKKKIIKQRNLSEARRKMHAERSYHLPSGKNVQPSPAGSKEKIRNKAWKRIPTKLSRTKRNTPGRPMAFRHMHQAIEKAKQESSNQHKARQLISDMHKRNIDALLASNGLKRVRIEGDGNCLFKAVCVSTCDFESPEILRQKLCDHLSAKLDTYIDFLPNNTCANKMDKYISKVNFLREEGHWDNDLADALPLAIANVSGRVLKIYCSRRANSMYEIRPTLHADTDANDCINLAFIQVPGLEHYDACTNATTPKNANYDFTDT